MRTLCLIILLACLLLASAAVRAAGEPESPRVNGTQPVARAANDSASAPAAERRSSRALGKRYREVIQAVLSNAAAERADARVGSSAQRAAHAQSERTRVAGLQVAQRDAQRAAHAQSKRARVAALPATAHDAQRAAHAQSKRARVAGLTAAERDAQQSSLAQIERARRAGLPAAARSAQRSANAQRMQERRAAARTTAVVHVGLRRVMGEPVDLARLQLPRGTDTCSAGVDGLSDLELGALRAFYAADEQLRMPPACVCCHERALMLQMDHAEASL